MAVVRFLKSIYLLPYYYYIFLKLVFYSLFQMLRTKQLSSLHREIILVTEAGSGIGRQVSLRINKIYTTAEIILWDADKKGLEETKKLCQNEKIHTYFVNLSKKQQITDAATSMRKNYGTVTLLCNMSSFSNCEEFSKPETCQVEDQIKAGLLSYKWTIEEFLPDMIKYGKGHVVSTCSTLAFYRFTHVSSHEAFNGGLQTFVDDLKTQVEKHPCKPDIKFTTVYYAPITEGPLHADVKYTIPGLLAIKPEHVAVKLVDGILQKKPQIFVPESLKYVQAIYRFLPVQFVKNFDDQLQINVKVKAATTKLIQDFRRITNQESFKPVQFRQ